MKKALDIVKIAVIVGVTTLASVELYKKYKAHTPAKQIKEGQKIRMDMMYPRYDGGNPIIHLLDALSNDKFNNMNTRREPFIKR